MQELERSRIRVLSLACAFPTPRLPGAGIFVRHRLWHLASLADVKVIAPVSLLSYSAGVRAGARGIPRVCQDGALEVWHPRWI